MVYQREWKEAVLLWQTLGRWVRIRLPLFGDTDRVI